MRFEGEKMAEIVNYSRRFYTGGFRYRTLGGVAFFVIYSLGTLVALYFLIFRSAGIPIFLWVIPVGMVIGVITLAYLIITDGQLSFSITIDGITNGGRFVPWSEIDRLGVSESHLGISIGYLFFAKKSSRNIHRRLMSSSQISRVEFEDLAKRLRAELKESYPGLRLGVYEAHQDPG
jgi:hypothetical protein